jgi:hypothetical protein
MLSRNTLRRLHHLQSAVFSTLFDAVKNATKILLSIACKTRARSYTVHTLQKPVRYRLAAVSGGRRASRLKAKP